MLPRLQTFRRLAIASALAVAAGVSQAADIVEHVVNYGMPSLPFSTSLGQTYLLPNAPTILDRFYDDYGFIVPESTFSSISATFNLGTALSIGDLQLRLIAGDPWSGSLPGLLSAGDLAARTVATVAMGTGSGSVETIDAVMLVPGHYFLEVSGVVTGSFGGSYGGVLNIVPVPEAPGLPMALAGAAVLGLLVRRRRA